MLVPRRVEGYRSRTVERGVLQLQAIVDQFIADVNYYSAANTYQQQTCQSAWFSPLNLYSGSVLLRAGIDVYALICPLVRDEIEVSSFKYN